MSALTYVIIAGVFVVVMAVLKLLLPLILGGGGETGALPYESKGTLVTPAERSFLGVLDQVVGQHYRIMAQVRVADVISVKKGLDKQSWGRAFGKIKAKHLDFVACDPNDLSIQFAVELDDSSHKRKDRVERDKFLNEAMQAAGIPLYRFTAKKSYNPQEIHNAIFGEADNSQPKGLS